MTVVKDMTIAYDRQMTMEAILDRDQRTTSHRFLDHCILSNGLNNTAASNNMTTFTKWYKAVLDKKPCYAAAVAPRINRNDQKKIHLSRDSYTVPAFYDDRGIRSRHNASVTATTWLRLGSLLLTLLVVSVHSAPTMTLEDKRHNSPPKWVNPCGLAAEDFTGDLDVVQLTDSQLLQQVVLQAKTALMHAELFRDDYIRAWITTLSLCGPAGPRCEVEDTFDDTAKRTFNIDFADLHASFKNSHFDWLPEKQQIPKELGEQLKQEDLDKLELDTALINTYEYMQKFAVGLEQVVWDQEDLNLQFSKQFKATETALRTVLCELQVALVERQLSPRPDVSRDIMKSDIRGASSETYRTLRDWVIFRDYMNGLEYVVQVFEHLLRGLQS